MIFHLAAIFGDSQFESSAICLFAEAVIVESSDATYRLNHTSTVRRLMDILEYVRIIP